MSTQPYQHPRTFSEYLERYPQGIQSFLYSKHYHDGSEFDDAYQSIVLSMIQSRAIENYNPARNGNQLTEKSFLGYVSMCLNRKLATYKAENRTWTNRAVQVYDADDSSTSHTGISSDKFEMLLSEPSPDSGWLESFETYAIKLFPETESMFAAIRANEFSLYERTDFRDERALLQQLFAAWTSTSL